MTRRSTQLWAGLAVSAAAIALFLLEAPLGLRMWVGLPVVLIVPGHALVCVLDPRDRLGTAERLALSLGASIALTTSGGLLLSGSAAGLQAVTWNAWLAGSSIMLHLLALHSVRTRPEALRPGLAPDWRRALVRSLTVFALTSASAMALAATVATTSIGSEHAVEQGEANVLQLWALPDHRGDVLVGLENPTASTVGCTLRVRHGSELVLARSLVLPPRGGTTLRVKPSGEASIMFPVRIELVAQAEMDAIREVSVWPYSPEARAEAVAGTGG
ncbi:MAG: DUF1616 domain-containing protein [Coriobacteriia bacterium]